MTNIAKGHISFFDFCLTSIINGFYFHYQIPKGIDYRCCSFVIVLHFRLLERYCFIKRYGLPECFHLTFFICWFRCIRPTLNKFHAISDDLRYPAFCTVLGIITADLQPTVYKQPMPLITAITNHFSNLTPNHYRHYATLLLPLPKHNQAAIGNLQRR